jgi:hypothetical protein
MKNAHLPLLLDSNPLQAKVSAEEHHGFLLYFAKI